MRPALDLSISKFNRSTRGDDLAQDFLSCLGKINNDKEILIPSGFIADYIAFGWIEMREGYLHPTRAGESMADRMSKERRRTTQSTGAAG
jgi:hypothetical protein